MVASESGVGKHEDASEQERWIGETSDQGKCNQGKEDRGNIDVQDQRLQDDSTSTKRWTGLGIKV